MGNSIRKSNNTFETIKIKENLIDDSEYIENFRETFWDIDFIGMKVELAVKIFNDNGYNNIRLANMKINSSGKLKKQVIIITDEDEKYVIEKPYFI